MDIKKIIRKAGWTLEQVAAQMTASKDSGLTQSALSQRLKNPKLSTLQEISGIIKIPLSDMFSDGDVCHSDVITCPNCGKKFRVIPIDETEQ